jgi:hypothetical protein
VRTSHFRSNEEVTNLVNAFETGAIPAADFSHAAHMAVALHYAEHIPNEELLPRMRDRIRAFAHHHGVDGLYHETLTTFWMRLITHLHALYNVDLPLWRRINLITERWGTRLPIEAHFSPELIASPAARVGWVEPDRLPLPF